MKTSVVRSTWLPIGGYRLDCSPYLGGAIETEILLEELPVKKEPLESLTKAIFNGPQFVRNYVTDPEYGVPFMTGSTMLLADLSDLPLLSKRDAQGTKLRHLKIEPGMSLISCSGSIGKMSYSREEMKGVWSSQDILKVVPDPERIPPGYLYAFLSSKFGVPLITSGTYGAIIQHLEPQHIAKLSVPRFGAALENEIHTLIEEAARLRTEANQRMMEAMEEYHQKTGLKKCIERLFPSTFTWISVSSAGLQGRLDTNFHRAYHLLALEPFSRGDIRSCSVGSRAKKISEPLRFKRIEINDSSAIGFFGTGTLGDVDPEPLYKIVGGAGAEPYRVDPFTLLVPRSGQIYGIIGRCFQPIGKVLNSAITEDAIRIHCESPEVSGFLFLALRSPFGLRQLKARCFGGSIPHLDVNNIGAVLIPDLPEKAIQCLGNLAMAIPRLRNQAIDQESKARLLLEDAIQRKK